MHLTLIPFHNRLSQITKVIFAFAIFISYALQCFVPVNIIWENYVSDKIKTSPKSSSYQLLLRVVITIITCKFINNIIMIINDFNLINFSILVLFAAAIPRLGLFISLFGAFCLSILGLAFPAIMELCVLWPDQLGPGNWILWKDVALVVFAIIGLVSGTYTSMRDIILSFM